MFAGLDQDRYDRQYTDFYLFKRLVTYFRKFVKQVIVISVMGVIVSLALAVVPILIAFGVDQLENEGSTNILLLIVGALFLSVVIEYTANWVRRRLVGRVAGSVVMQMRKDAFAAAVDRDMAFYDENKTGKVLSRITNDTEEFGQVLIISTDLLSEVIQVAILLGVLFSRNALLTVILFIFTLPMIAATYVFRRLARKITRQGSRAMAQVNDNIQETVTGISIAKNFRQEAMIYEDFVRVNTQSYRINLQRGMVLSAVFPVLNALAGFATSSVLYGGALAVTDGIMSVSIWYLYIQSVDRFWFPVINISTYWSQFQQAMSALERIFALIDAENTVVQTDSRKISDIKGRISFKDVTFEYKSGQTVLRHFNLNIEPGESVAFVGHTGAGKSSITKLILRLYEFQQGQICVDDQDIRTVDLEHYRSQLGFVPQTPFLFSGTIADNIRYGKPDASDAEIKKIAYSIGSGEWLETLPDGLQSDVGERGSRLSLGQRQLVSLLRVLVQKPAIFILDEATASVDNFTEIQLQEAIEMILAQSTSILIAHRLSTVRGADRIIVLREGSIIEEGSHDALMTQGGHYAELYNTYFRHQSMEYVENARAMLMQGENGRKIRLPSPKPN